MQSNCAAIFYLLLRAAEDLNGIDFDGNRLEVCTGKEKNCFTMKCFCKFFIVFKKIVNEIQTIPHVHVHVTIQPWS